MDNELKIEYLPVGSLKPYEKNARKHQDADVQTIVASIKEFGFDDPIGVWGEDNLIVEGHGRLMAAKKLGMETVPVIHLDHLTDEQRRAYALAHNKTAEMSEWDFDSLEQELDELSQDFDMSEFGFDIDFETSGESPEETAEPKKETSFNYTEQYGVIVMCSDEAEQEQIYNRLTDEGYTCKVVAV